MEESSSNYSSESEDTDEIVFSYLKTRRYIDQKEENLTSILPGISVDCRETEVTATAAYDSSDHSIISFSTCTADINLAEQQTNAFKIWLTEMKDEVCQKEVYQMIMPMLCHVYLDCLRNNPTGNLDSCKTFINRHAREPLLTRSWMPLLNELLSLQSLTDIEKMPLVKAFRSSKSEIRLSTRTLIALRKFLTRRKCTLLLQVLRSRFKVESITTDGHFVPEEELVYSPSILKYSKQPNVNTKPEEQKKVEKQNKVRKKKRKKTETIHENGEAGGEEDAEARNNQDSTDLFVDNGRLSIDNGRLVKDSDRLSSDNGLLIDSDRLNLENERLDGEKFDDDLISIENDRLTTGNDRLVSDPSGTGQKVDIDLDNLVSEIMRMRLRPTPPPPLLLYTAHKTDGVVCGEVCSTGKFAATGDHRSELRVWCLSETKHNPQLHPSYFSSVNIQASTDPINDLQAVNSKQWWSLRGHCDTVYDCAFTPNSDYLLSVSFDTTMRLWNLHDYSCTAVYRGHTRPVWGVSISPVHNMVATSSSDKTARLWSLDRTFPVRILAGHTFDVMCCVFHPNGMYCATGGVDRSIRLWSVTDGTMVRAMGQQPQQDFVECLTFSPNGQFLASAGGDNWVWVWDLASGQLLYRLECPASRLTSLSWSSDGSSIAASSHDGAVFLWHLDTPQEGSFKPRKYTTKCSTVLSVQYSTKNSLVAVGLAEVSAKPL